MSLAAPPAAALAAILNGTGSTTRRAVIYQSDGATVYDPDPGMVDGTISLDYTRDERRTCDITFWNSSGKLVHAVGQFWYDKIIQIFRGIKYPTGSWECSVGVYMIDGIKSLSQPRTIDVTGRDLTKLGLISELQADTLFQQGSVLETVIGTLATNAGYKNTILPTTGLTLAADYLITSGTTRWKAMNDLCVSYGYELFVDAVGFLVMREFRDPVVAPLAWTFQTGPQVGNISSYTKISSDTDLFNHIVVVGQSTGFPPIWAEAINTNPSSPTNVTQIGDRVKTITDPLVTTTDQAFTEANNYLVVSALEDWEFDLNTLCFPWLEGGEIVQIIDPLAATGDPTRFLLTSYSLPIGLGPMQPIAKRVSVIGATPPPPVIVGNVPITIPGSPVYATTGAS